MAVTTLQPIISVIAYLLGFW